MPADSQRVGSAAITWESRERPLFAKVMEEFHLGTRQDQLMFAMSFLMGKSGSNKLSDYHARQRTP